MTVLPPDAARLIAQIGKSVTLKKVTATSYNRATGTATPTLANDTVQALVLNYSNRERDGTLVQAGDRKVVLDAATVTTAPNANDIITIGSVDHRIVSMQLVEEAGTAVVYTCQVRR
jgi:hypothetical protein